MARNSAFRLFLLPFFLGFFLGDGAMAEEALGDGAMAEEAVGNGDSARHCLKTGCGEKGPFLIESESGFFTHFLVGETDSRNQIEDPSRLLAWMEKRNRLKPMAFQAPFLKLSERGYVGKSKPKPVFLLAGKIYAEKPQNALLRYSLLGKMGLSLNGKTLLLAERDQMMQEDDHFIEVQLEKGWNQLAIRLEKLSPHALSFGMRLEDSADAPKKGRFYAAYSGKTPSACLFFDFEKKMHLEKNAWTLEVTGEERGLLPFRGFREWALYLGDEKRAFGSLQKGRFLHHLEMPIGASEKGLIRLMVDGEACWSLQWKGREGEKKRFLALRERAHALKESGKFTASELGSLAFHLNEIEKGLLALSEGAKDSGKKAEGRRKGRFEAWMRTLQEEIEAAEATGRLFQGAGLHTRALSSVYGGDLKERYVLALPKDYHTKPQKKWPLIMMSHGLLYTPEDMMDIALKRPKKRGTTWESGDWGEKREKLFHEDAILVAMNHYGDAGPRPPGEVATLEVLEDLKAHYRIDERRVSITGFSLGGSVAFWLPFHYPGLFSASAPLCGYPNVPTYFSVRRHRHEAWEKRLIQEEGILPYMASGKDLPLWMFHGEKDQPERSEMAKERYDELGFSAKLDILPLGHQIWDEVFQNEGLLDWLSKEKRPAFPKEIALKSYRLRWGESHWLKMEGFLNQGAPEWEGGELKGRIKGTDILIETKGLRGFAILGEKMHELIGKGLRIVVDKEDLGSMKIEGELHFERVGRGEQGKKWERTRKASEVNPLERRPLHKKAGLEGPLSDLWFGKALVVYGTQVKEEREANQQAAKRHAFLVPWVDLHFQVKADVDVLEEDLKGQHVVLVGRPETNLWTKRAEGVLKKAGLSFEGGGIRLGKAFFSGKGTGISMIYPSAFDEAHYMVIHAGLDAEGTRSSRYLPRFSPDFLVYDRGIRLGFDDFVLGKRKVLAGGFFDEDWALPDAFFPLKRRE